MGTATTIASCSTHTNASAQRTSFNLMRCEQGSKPQSFPLSKNDHKFFSFSGTSKDRSHSPQIPPSTGFSDSNSRRSSTGITSVIMSTRNVLKGVEIARRSKNARFRHSLFGDVTSIYLSQSLCRISLMKINVAKTFIRVWKVLELCFQLLVHGKQVTQRELFYKLLSSSPKYFDSQVQVNKSVQDVVSLLCCSRNSLGLMPSSRGTVVGRLLIQEENQEIVDCSLLGPAGQAITGNLHLLENFVFQSNARYIFVIEKDAIFQRLAEDRIFNHIPSILVTAKGYPDIATRVFLHRLSKIFPTLPILALVDWNPAGLAILCTYKFGSIGMGLEAYRYACDVKWLGLRSDDLMLVPQDSKVMMKTRDLQIAKSLMSSDMLQDHKYKEELRAMIQGGQRVEIEALYAHGYEFLGRYMVTKVVQDDYF